MAHDDDRGTLVAVKELIDPEADIDRFEREIRLLVEQIHNPNVVTIYGYDMKAVPPYFVMEYCDGGSLRSWIGKATWQQTAFILLHAASGLLGIHNTGGFHRDIKPDNLLLGRLPGVDGFVVKVADFGLARRPKTAQPPMTLTPGGTPGYMAPELSQPGAQFSIQADIYSLGIVGLELLTGDFSPNSPSKLAACDAPVDLKNLLIRMASPWAALRPSTADLIIALPRLLGMPYPAPPPPQPMVAAQEPPRPASNGGLGWLLLGGLAAAALALAAGDKKEWDANVGRYRGPDGQFK